ncbi:hypothetical protein L2E82_51058 [Cichorium intybus]|nr:hypothetical protein L2E82_51058 [Cichorium intybus]
MFMIMYADFCCRPKHNINFDQVANPQDILIFSKALKKAQGEGKVIEDITLIVQVHGDVTRFRLYVNSSLILRHLILKLFCHRIVDMSVHERKGCAGIDDGSAVSVRSRHQMPEVDPDPY